MSTPSRPVVLPPVSPSELLDYVLGHHSHPTALLICWPRQRFIDALVHDVRQHLPSAGTPSPHDHPLLAVPTLGRVAVSRHVHVAFVPSVIHLRSYLATFFVADATAPPPMQKPARSSPPPLLLVYGFLELHRNGDQWSAQALNTSAAGLVETAARNGLRAAIAEPTRADNPDDENVPLLHGSTMRDDGSWRGRIVPVRRVLGRWFDREAPDDTPDRTPETHHAS